jgi:hypothetical protein
MKTVDVKNKISINELREMAKKMDGELVKAVVDIEKGVMVVDAEMHVDEEAFLLDHEAKQKNLWGINLYPDKPQDQFIEFDSMINIRPWQDNRSRHVNDPTVRRKIIKIVDSLVVRNET